jgi:simple sugar transport system permease protein
MKIVFSDRQLAFLVAMNVAIVLVATAVSDGLFIDIDNLQSMGGQVSELGILSAAVMLAMISGNGGIDLSVVALANLSGVAAGLLAPLLFSPDDAPLAFTLAFAGIALLTGALGGLVNGLLIAQARMTPILATLGTQLLYTGLAVGFTNGSAVRIGYVEELSAIGNETIFSIPIPFLIFGAIVLLLGIVLRHSPFGIRLFLMGTNPKAARYAGIPENRMLITTYTICGVLAAIAGVIIASRTSSAKWDFGSSYLMIAILTVVMAGVKPEGGYGRALCLFFSATTLQVMSSAFNLVGISSFFRDFAWGALLLLSLASGRFDLGSFFRRRAT